MTTGMLCWVLFVGDEVVLGQDGNVVVVCCGIEGTKFQPFNWTLSIVVAF